MNVPRFVIFALMLFCSLLSAQGKISGEIKVNTKICKEIEKNIARNDLDCGPTRIARDCPSLAACVRKKFSKPPKAKKGFSANLENCRGMKERTKNVSKTRLNKIENCKTAGCEKFKVCRKFWERVSEWSRKFEPPLKNGKPKNGKPKNETSKNGKSNTGK
jgi:hypothetical protein